MGYSDFYPFVISDPVVHKLQFIHELCLKNAGMLVFRGGDIKGLSLTLYSFFSDALNQAYMDNQ